MSNMKVPDWLKKTFGNVAPKEVMTKRGKRIARSVSADSLGPEWRPMWGSRNDPGYAREALEAAGVS
jgi:hypothetical protein